MIWIPLALARSMSGAIWRARIPRGPLSEHQCLFHMSQITMAVELMGNCSAKLNTHSDAPRKSLHAPAQFRVRFLSGVGS